MNAKQWIFGISGGIAAYKTPELVRLLKKQHCEVRVVLSKNAPAFVAPLTLQAVSGHRVYSDMMDPDFEASMGHIDLARWAQGILIAPLSANRLAALALGMADDLLTTLCLVTKAPIYVAPAMNQQMWHHPATQQHIQSLKVRGVTILGPAFGEQACGEVGLGRMLEPQEIMAELFPIAEPPALACLKGKKILITAGPTQEHLDPVRFLSNRSSGKMGFALAQVAQQAGAQVTLISGPVSLNTPTGVERINVISAQQMLACALAHSQKSDIFISTAAVADFRPESEAVHKIKKQGATWQLLLVENPDILACVAAQSPRPFCVGFAAETTDHIAHAQKKLQQKNIDIIALNDVSRTDIGFDSDQNALTVLSTQATYPISIASKHDVAGQLLHIISECFDEKNKTKDSGSPNRQRDPATQLCD